MGFKRKIAAVASVKITRRYAFDFFFTTRKMSAKINIEKWNSRVDGTLTVESMEKKLQKLGYNCTMYEFSPGTKFPDHTHGVSKKDSIVTGKFQFCMYGETVILEPGDMVDVPKNTIHNAEVVGNQSVVFFDATK